MLPSESRNSPRYPALLCALGMVLCVLATVPLVEMGLNDDWSYIASALSLARTGHIHYNGWSTAMLGWQLYLGALFIKLFGFSFTVVRASILLVGAATVVLLQRIALRLGLSPANAVLATLTVALSPLFLCLSFSFMSDIPGLCAILLCLYMCLRAEQAATDQSSALWLVAAALTNALAGSVRQIAWLGLLVMVPSVAWHLRARRRVLLLAALSCVAGAAIVFALMHWFKLQPYMVSESLIPRNDAARDPITLHEHITNLVDAVSTIALFCLPVLLAFLVRIPALAPRRRKLAFFFIACFALFALVETFHRKSAFGTPLTGNIVGPGGIPDNFQLPGAQLQVFNYPILNLLDFAILSSISAALLCWKGIQPGARGDATQRVSSTALFFLLAPFTAAYVLLTFTRFHVFDRYLLTLIAIAVLCLARFYQRRFNHLPMVTTAAIAIAAIISVVAMHDGFVAQRARLAAIDELRTSGIPRQQIRGGFEYDAWTEIEDSGYVNEPRLTNPAGAYRPQPHSPLPTECRYFFSDFTPSVNGKFGITYSPLPCFQPSGFAPVTYTTWLAPHRHQLFIQKLP